MKYIHPKWVEAMHKRRLISSRKAKFLYSAAFKALPFRMPYRPAADHASPYFYSDQSREGFLECIKESADATIAKLHANTHVQSI